jgi:hypothetical protein
MLTNGTTAQITMYSDLRFTTALLGLRKVDFQVPKHLRLLIGLQRDLLYTLIYDLRHKSMASPGSRYYYGTSESRFPSPIAFTVHRDRGLIRSKCGYLQRALQFSLAWLYSYDQARLNHCVYNLRVWDTKFP